MKVIHYLWIASAIISLGLFVAGFLKAAAVVFGLMTLVEIIVSAFSGKQTNDGMR